MAFFNRGEIYTVVTDLETSFWVQRFAENHRVERTIIDVVRAGDFITVSFRSKERRAKINKKLKNTFKTICNVQTGEYVVLITKK